MYVYILSKTFQFIKKKNLSVSTPMKYLNFLSSPLLFLQSYFLTHRILTASLLEQNFPSCLSSSIPEPPSQHTFPHSHFGRLNILGNNNRSSSEKSIVCPLKYTLCPKFGAVPLICIDF